MTSSNSITNFSVRMDWVDLLTNLRNRERGMDLAKMIPQTQAALAYSSSKCALARWVRRVSPSWAVDGLRINDVAPGNTTTPMTKNLTEQQRDAALLIPIPTRYGTREFLDAEEIANAIFCLPPGYPRKKAARFFMPDGFLRNVIALIKFFCGCRLRKALILQCS